MLLLLTSTFDRHQTLGVSCQHVNTGGFHFLSRSSSAFKSYSPKTGHVSIFSRSKMCFSLKLRYFQSYSLRKWRSITLGTVPTLTDERVAFLCQFRLLSALCGLETRAVFSALGPSVPFLRAQKAEILIQA